MNPSPRCLALAAAALTLTFGARVVRADATSVAREAITAAYAKQSAAIPKGDFETYASTHTKDFYETDKTGRKQNLDAIKQVMPVIVTMMKNLKRTVTIQSVTVSGKKATVGATEKVDGQVTNPQTNKTSTFHAERTMTDTWVQAGGKWLRKMSKTLTEKQTLDGKPFGTGR